MADRKRNIVSGILLVTALASFGAYAWQRAHESSVVHAKTRPPAPPEVPMPEVPVEPFPAREMELVQKLKALHNSGNFEGALTFATTELALLDLDPKFRTWLGRQLPPLLTSVGWLKLKLGECDEATKFFYRATKIGAIAETRKGLGVCLHQTKNWPEAASWLAAYILEKPDDAETRALYADVLESLGRFDEAVSILEGAAQIAGLDATVVEAIQQRLQGMRVKAREGVRQRSEYSRHFYVSYREDDHDRLVSTVFEALESALEEFTEVTGIPAPEAPIEVVLYRREAFHDVIPGGPAWSEGIFDGRIRVPLTPEIAQDPRGLMATVLRHELSHALLATRSAGRPWPPWFDEGLAQYLSCRRRPCDGFHFAATPGQFSEASLLSEPFVTLGDIEAGRAYAHSLYLVRMLVRTQSEDVIPKIIRDLPAQGAITSDILANLAQGTAFGDLVQAAKAPWSQKTLQ